MVSVPGHRHRNPVSNHCAAKPEVTWRHWPVRSAWYVAPSAACRDGRVGAAGPSIHRQCERPLSYGHVRGRATSSPPDRATMSVAPVGFQPCRKPAQQPVAFGVAISVMDALEAVDAWQRRQRRQRIKPTSNRWRLHGANPPLHGGLRAAGQRCATGPAWRSSLWPAETPRPC